MSDYLDLTDEDDGKLFIGHVLTVPAQVYPLPGLKPSRMQAIGRLLMAAPDPKD